MSAPASSLALAPADRERLRDGAAALGVDLDVTALRRFETYAELLDRWSRATNLISCGSVRELVDRHFLDSLACAWLCQAARAIVDLGSGAGFPGMPLAIVDPSRRIDLVEPRRRRASFLRDVKRTLGLTGVTVQEMRAEDRHVIHDFVPVDVAVSRAVWADERGLTVAAPWVRSGAIVLAMRGADHVPGTGGLGELTLEQTLTYRIGRNRRRLEVYRKNASP